MKRLMTMCAILAFASACTDDSGAQRALEGQGFTNIHLGGFDPFACGKDDTFSNSFTATNAAGKTVSGTVCCGLLKSCTVRF